MHDKSFYRKRLLEKRKALDASLHLAWSHQICTRTATYIQSLNIKNPVIALYMPIHQEVDILLLSEVLNTICLPVIREGKQLAFRAYHKGDRLEKGKFGVMQPSADAPVLIPDIVIVPVVAFDEAKSRIGYGAGYYDATLSCLRQQKPIISIGVAFALQKVESIVREEHDVVMDVIITEDDRI